MYLVNGRIITMHFLDEFVATLGTLGDWTYLLAFTASLVESLAFVGILIPGSAVVVLAGFSAGQGVVHPITLIWFVAIGAAIGDGLSYYLGTRGTNFFKEDNKFFKTSHLEKSRLFFEKHGNKSIFLARFIGPLRPFVPFLAGVSRMKVGVFLFWNILSAFLWSVCFVLLGYFFGHAFKTIEMWITRAGLIVVFVIFLIFAIWYGIKKARQPFNFLNRWF